MLVEVTVHAVALVITPGAVAGLLGSGVCDTDGGCLPRYWHAASKLPSTVHAVSP